nr:MAG TPA: hypothetical protein [Caudoviricetes sp.]
MLDFCNNFFDFHNIFLDLRNTQEYNIVKSSVIRFIRRKIL